jgi:hypothetical protein
MDIIWGTVLSKSYVAVMSHPEQEKMKEEVEQLILKYFPHLGDDKIESVKKVIDMPYNTDIAWVEKRT